MKQIFKINTKKKIIQTHFRFSLEITADRGNISQQKIKLIWWAVTFFIGSKNAFIRHAYYTGNYESHIIVLQQMHSLEAEKTICKEDVYIHNIYNEYND